MNGSSSRLFHIAVELMDICCCAVVIFFRRTRNELRKLRLNASRAECDISSSTQHQKLNDFCSAKRANMWEVRKQKAQEQQKWTLQNFDDVISLFFCGQCSEHSWDCCRLAVWVQQCKVPCCALETGRITLWHNKIAIKKNEWLEALQISTRKFHHHHQCERERRDGNAILIDKWTCRGQSRLLSC